MDALAAAGRRSARRWLLPVLLAGQTMATLDGSIVNVALPSIARDLRASGAALQLVVAGYLLAYAVLLVAGARLGDSRGYRTLFVGGLAAFTLASLACGLATTTWMLLAARVAQGAAAAFMVPQVLSLIQHCFAGAERTRALSQYSAVLSLGVAAGQVLGGLLVTADLAGATWRPVFLVNVPFGAVLLVAARRQLPDLRVGARTFDLPGVASLAVAMTLLVVPLVLGREMGWPAWSLASLALAVPALCAFGLIERAARARDRGPLLDLSLLADRVVAGGLGAIVLVMAGYAAFIFMFTLHLQSGLGYAPLRASLTFLPYAAGFGLASLNWRRMPAPWQRWVTPAGFAMMGAGLAALAVVLPAGGPPAIVVPLMLVAGAGHAAAFAPLAVAVTASVRPGQAASLSAMISTGTTLAAVLGVAAGGTAFLAAAQASGSARGLQVVAAGLAAIMLLAAAATALPWARGRPHPVPTAD
jgi:MFS family permease